MASFVVWLDSKEGKIFELTTSGPKVAHVHAHGSSGKLKLGAIDHSGSHGLDPLFKEMADSLKNCDEMILLGPSEAKLHFKKYLENHFKHTLAQKIVAVETVDHPTDNQILAHARKFFRTFDAFH